MKIAVIPGSFDPVTYGHLNIITRAAALFDQVYVVAMFNEQKQYFFTPEERLAMLRESVSGFGNVTADFSRGMLVDYVREKHACAIVKGVRTAADADYEINMAHINKRLYEGAETLLLPAEAGLRELSSSLVHARTRLGEDVSPMVPPGVVRAYEKKK